MTAHPVALELAATLEPDFICIDLQHGADWAQISASTFTALDRYGVPTLVRVPANDPAPIGRSLDLGAAGVIVPLVNTAEEAAAAVAACRYPPAGMRSYGLQTPRIPAGVDGALCVVQIETREALGNVREIIAVDGVDWLYVGPSDLGMSLGGQPAYDVVSIFDGSHPLSAEMTEALATVIAAAREAGKLAGLHCAAGRAGLVAEANGFSVTSIATDVSAMRRDMEQQLAIVRGQQEHA